MKVVQMVFKRLMTEQRGEVLKAKLTEEKKTSSENYDFYPLDDYMFTI